MKWGSEHANIWGMNIVEGRRSEFKRPDYCDLNTFGLRAQLRAAQGYFCSNSTSGSIPPNDLSKEFSRHSLNPPVSWGREMNYSTPNIKTNSQ